VQVEQPARDNSGAAQDTTPHSVGLLAPEGISQLKGLIVSMDALVDAYEEFADALERGIASGSLSSTTSLRTSPTGETLLGIEGAELTGFHAKDLTELMEGIYEDCRVITDKLTLQATTTACL